MLKNYSEVRTPSAKKNNDIAGRDYWNEAWADRKIASPINPHNNSLKNYVNIRFHNIFRRVLSNYLAGAKLLEIGCAGSAWLPYFALEFGFEVTGIDYSDVGCLQARDLLAQAGVDGKVHQADMFDVPDIMRNAFDVVITFGVIEHFTDTASCLKTLSSYCKPGGTLISIIPNMHGINGILQKATNKEVFSVHKVLSAEELTRFCTEAELETICSEYLPFFNPGAVNIGFAKPHTMMEFVMVYLRKVLTAFAMIIWSAEKVLRPIDGNRLTSSSIINISNSKK